MIGRRSLLALPPALLLTAAAKGAPGGALHWDSGYLFLRVRVSGRSADALLDINAPRSLVDRRHAAALGIGAGARPSIEAAGRRIDGLAVSLSDLADYANFSLHGRIALVLGRDFFATGAFLLDLAGFSLTPLPAPGGRGGRALPLTDRFGTATIPVTIDRQPAAAALSLRDHEPVMLRAGFAAKPGIGRRGYGGAAAARQGVTIGKLELAGRTFANIAAALNAGERTPDAWIGPDILRHFRIGLDLAARTVWFDPA